MALKPRNARLVKAEHTAVVQHLRALGCTRAEVEEALGVDPRTLTRNEAAAILAAWIRQLPTQRTRKP